MWYPNRASFSSEWPGLRCLHCLRILAAQSKRKRLLLRRFLFIAHAKVKLRQHEMRLRVARIDLSGPLELLKRLANLVVATDSERAGAVR